MLRYKVVLIEQVMKHKSVQRDSWSHSFTNPGAVCVEFVPSLYNCLSSPQMHPNFLPYGEDLLVFM